MTAITGRRLGGAVVFSTIRARRIALATGSIDAPTGLALKEHIFVASKGDYDGIADGLPQKAAS
jgi:hypothetical protein